MGAVEEMKRAAKMLKRGELSISEAEKYIDNVIDESTVYNGEIDGLDAYVKNVRYLKRKKYYLLLDATRR